MTQIVCKDTHKRRDYKIKLHLFAFILLIKKKKNKETEDIKRADLTASPFKILSKIQIGMT